MVASGGLMLSWFAVLAAVAGLTDSDAVLVPAFIVAFLALIGGFLWIAFAYAGRPKGPFSTMKQRLRVVVASLRELDGVADDADSLRAEIDRLRVDEPVTREQRDQLTSRAGKLATRLDAVVAQVQRVRSDPPAETRDDERGERAP
jgi:outer membrane murein-binding lipoprotein Lpp